MTKRLRYILTMPEFILMLIVVLLVLIGLMMGLPLLIPQTNMNRFGMNFKQLSFAMALQGIVISIPRLRKLLKIENTIPYFILIMGIQMVFLLMVFNLKAWSPIINKTNYDLQLYNIDKDLDFIKQGLLNVRGFVANGFQSIGIDVDGWYSTVFYNLFMIAYVLYAVFGSVKTQRKVFTTVYLTYLLGTFGYWVMPSVGPFIFGDGANALATDYQHYMYTKYTSFMTLRDTSDYFGASPAAMPSLHVAFSFIFAIFAGKYLKPLLIFCVPAFLWIAIESVCSNWHYMLDVPAGLLIGVLAMKVADSLVEAHEQQAAAPQGVYDKALEHA